MAELKKPLTHAASKIKHPGAVKKAAAAAGQSTYEWEEEHKHDSNPKTRARATLGLAFRHANKK